MEVNGDQQWENKDSRPRKKEVGLMKVVSEYRSRFSEGENEKNSKVKKGRARLYDRNSLGKPA